MLFILKEKNISSEMLDAITRFADGNAFVAFSVLITLLSAGLLYVALKKEKIDKKFFPLIWFFLITNFLFSIIISLGTIPLKKEADIAKKEFEDLRNLIEKLEEVAEMDKKNVLYLIDENRKLRESLLKKGKFKKRSAKNPQVKNQNAISEIKIPEEPKLLKTEKKHLDVKREIILIDSLRQIRNTDLQ